jgi:hypothetical protein
MAPFCRHQKIEVHRRGAEPVEKIFSDSGIKPVFLLKFYQRIGSAAQRPTPLERPLGFHVTNPVCVGLSMNYSAKCSASNWVWQILHGLPFLRPADERRAKVLS